MKTWKCIKCNTRNNISIPRCGWCSAPRPEDLYAAENAAADKVEAGLLNNIQNAVKKMPHAQRTRLWRWMEDNII